MRKRSNDLGGSSPLALALAAGICWPLPSAGHAIVVESSPGLNAVVGGPGIEVMIRFNSRIDKERSRVLLRGLGKVGRVAFGSGGAPDRIETRLEGLGSGAYALEWQVLGVDGHITRGSIPFRVL